MGTIKTLVDSAGTSTVIFDGDKKGVVTKINDVEKVVTKKDGTTVTYPKGESVEVEVTLEGGTTEIKTMSIAALSSEAETEVLKASAGEPQKNEVLDEDTATTAPTAATLAPTAGNNKASALGSSILVSAISVVAIAIAARA